MDTERLLSLSEVSRALGMWLGDTVMFLKQGGIVSYKDEAGTIPYESGTIPGGLLYVRQVDLDAYLKTQQDHIH